MQTKILNMSKERSLNFIAEILSMFFAFFLIYTATYKMLNVEAFRFNIARTAVFPESALAILPYLVIAMEYAIVVLLFFFPKLGLKIFAATMLVFSIYISLLYYFGRYEVCGCGGILNGLEFKYHLLINLAFFGLAIYVQHLKKDRNYEK